MHPRRVPRSNYCHKNPKQTWNAKSLILRNTVASKDLTSRGRQRLCHTKKWLSDNQSLVTVTSSCSEHTFLTAGWDFSGRPWDVRQLESWIRVRVYSLRARPRDHLPPSPANTVLLTTSSLLCITYRRDGPDLCGNLARLRGPEVKALWKVGDAQPLHEAAISRAIHLA